MEWMNRAGNRPAQSANHTVAPNNAAGAPLPHHGGGKKKSDNGWSFHRVGLGIIVVSLAILLAGVVGLTMTVKKNDESRFVDGSKMQAVFLAGGQVYFGKIRALNSKYVGMNEIYYLRVNQQVQPNQQNNGQSQQQDISLVKLGCELHGPQDQMLMNREQVIFWENLKDDGQVAKAVAEYKKQNPDGQKCEANADQSSQQNQTNTNTNTTNTNNTNTNNTRR